MVTETKMEYRNEMKYLVSEAQLQLLKYRLIPVMKSDLHQKGGSYHIRSLYFDDYHNSCMKENEAGVDNREKYRIRIYDRTTDLIKLEQKSKLHGMTNKIAETITKEDCLLYMDGKSPKIDEETPFLIKKLASKMMAVKLKPVSIVEYERTAFVERKGNVRITFDRNVCGTDKIHTFFDTYTPAVPILAKGQHVLEVKYDEFLPDYIKKALDIGNLQRTSFSKYFLSRTKEGIDI